MHRFIHKMCAAKFLCVVNIMFLHRPQNTMNVNVMHGIMQFNRAAVLPFSTQTQSIYKMKSVNFAAIFSLSLSPFPNFITFYLQIVKRLLVQRERKAQNSMLKICIVNRIFFFHMFAFVQSIEILYASQCKTFNSIFE